MAASALMSIAEQSAHFLDRPHERAPAGAVGGEAAWLGADLRLRNDWIERVSPGFVAALEDVVARLRASARPWSDVSEADVELPGEGETLRRWRRALTHGRGFLILRGLPVERWDLATQHLATGVLGRQFGRLGLQNPRGDVIGEVRATGAEKVDPFARLYATAGEFRFHCDASDLVGLLCIRPAAEGGESRLASSVSVYNTLLATRPDLAARMFEPQPYDLRNEQAAGGEPYAAFAPCAFGGDRLRTFYISDYFRTVARHGIEPDLDLLDTYDAIAASPEVGLQFYLQPGDLQILDNHTMLHARSAFRDEPGRERLLLRFLVSMDRTAA